MCAPHVLSADWAIDVLTSWLTLLIPGPHA
jgi:hypothetical protein